MTRLFTHLTLDERRLLARLRDAGVAASRIAQWLGRHASTIYRELKCNHFADDVLPDVTGYFAVVANDFAKERRARDRKLRRDPSVPELARINGLSRAAFARAFGEALGQSPMQYLTDWRMTLARDHLCNGTMSLAEIADAIGYGSPYAFAAAFRRQQACRPDFWRQQATEPGDECSNDRIHLG